MTSGSGTSSGVKSATNVKTSAAAPISSCWATSVKRRLLSFTRSTRSRTPSCDAVEPQCRESGQTEGLEFEHCQRAGTWKSLHNPGI